MKNKFKWLFNFWEYGVAQTRGPSGRINKGTEMARRRLRTGSIEVLEHYPYSTIEHGPEYAWAPPEEIVRFIPHHVRLAT